MSVMLLSLLIGRLAFADVLAAAAAFPEVPDIACFASVVDVPVIFGAMLSFVSLPFLVFQCFWCPCYIAGVPAVFSLSAVVDISAVASVPTSVDEVFPLFLASLLIWSPCCSIWDPCCCWRPCFFWIPDFDFVGVTVVVGDLAVVVCCPCWFLSPFRSIPCCCWRPCEHTVLLFHT